MAHEIFDEYGEDPIALCQSWLNDARESELNDPETACLATADKDGRPSARMLLIKEISQNGFKFHTNEESQKGQAIAENPQVELCFYWKSTRKQIRVSGSIEQVSNEESSHYFQTRPIERQIGAWASKQSQPFDKKAALETALEKYRGEFSGKDNIPRPPYWKGYRIIPQTIEFWIGQEARVHTRFIYTQQNNGAWSATWLCP